MKQFVLPLATLLFAAGCSKQNDAPAVAADTKAPVVRLLSPQASQQYKTGDKLCVTANAIDESNIARLSVLIVKEGAAAPLYRADYPVNERSFMLDKKTIIVPASFSGACSVLVEAVDDKGNAGTASVAFTGNQ